MHSVTVSGPLGRIIIGIAKLTLPSSFKKGKKEESFDPALVAAVEAKLKALDVDSDALLSGPEAAEQGRDTEIAAVM